MRDENIPTIAERVGTALSSGDLRQKPGPCHLDKIAALGVVGINERLADAVFRLKYSNDHRSYHDALDGVFRLSRALDARQRWRLKRRRLWRMSRAVLDYWYADICRACNGVRYEVIHGSPHLSDRACGGCHGTGKNPMPWLHKRRPRRPEGKGSSPAKLKRWRDKCRLLEDSEQRHRALLVELERCELVIGDKMIRKLAAEARAA